MGKQEVRVGGHIEPITLSNKESDITLTTDDNHTLPPGERCQKNNEEVEQQQRVNVEVEPTSPHNVSQREEIDGPSQREQGTLPEDSGGPPEDPPQKSSKSILFGKEQEADEKPRFLV